MLKPAYLLCIQGAQTNAKTVSYSHALSKLFRAVGTLVNLAPRFVQAYHSQYTEIFEFYRSKNRFYTIYTGLMSRTTN